MTNSEEVATRILQREGMPKPQDIGDGQGLTGAGGQTQTWCDQWGLPFPSDESTAAMNLGVWFVRTNLLAVINANLALGDAVADFCYNSSLQAGVRAMQNALSVAPDGIIGSQTLAALSAHSADLSAFVRDVAIFRANFIASGVTHGTIRPQFCAGLIARALSFL